MGSRRLVRSSHVTFADSQFPEIPVVSMGWQQSARRLVDILLNGSQAIK
jgi:hypothetical protein